MGKFDCPIFCLAPAHWKLILERLYDVHIYRLLVTCPIIRNLVLGYLDELHLTSSSNANLKSLNLLPSLRAVTSHARIEMWSDLSNLPLQLKSFSSGFIAGKGAADLKNHSLRSLRVVAPFVSWSILKMLPSSLTQLSLHECITFSDPLSAALPRTLLIFHLKASERNCTCSSLSRQVSTSAVTDLLFRDLPPSLTDLAVHTSELFSALAIKLLPPTLSKLELRPIFIDATLSNRLPASITQVNLKNLKGDMASLPPPPQARKIVFTSFDAKAESKTDFAKLIRALPDSVQYFRIEGPKEYTIEDSYERLTNLQTLKVPRLSYDALVALPPSLTVLHVYTSARGVLRPHAHLLPRSLVDLVCDMEIKVEEMSNMPKLLARCCLNVMLGSATFPANERRKSTLRGYRETGNCISFDSRTKLSECQPPLYTVLKEEEEIVMTPELRRKLTIDSYLQLLLKRRFERLQREDPTKCIPRNRPIESPVNYQLGEISENTANEEEKMKAGEICPFCFPKNVRMAYQHGILLSDLEKHQIRSFSVSPVHIEPLRLSLKRKTPKNMDSPPHTESHAPASHLMDTPTLEESDNAMHLQEDSDEGRTELVSNLPPCLQHLTIQCSTSGDPLIMWEEISRSILSLSVNGAKEEDDNVGIQKLVNLTHLGLSSPLIIWSNLPTSITCLSISFRTPDNLKDAILSVDNILSLNDAILPNLQRLTISKSGNRDHSESFYPSTLVTFGTKSSSRIALKHALELAEICPETSSHLFKNRDLEIMTPSDFNDEKQDDIEVEKNEEPAERTVNMSLLWIWVVFTSLRLSRLRYLYLLCEGHRHAEFIEKLLNEAASVTSATPGPINLLHSPTLSMISWKNQIFTRKKEENENLISSNPSDATLWVPQCKKERQSLTEHIMDPLDEITREGTGTAKSSAPVVSAPTPREAHKYSRLSVATLNAPPSYPPSHPLDRELSDENLIALFSTDEQLDSLSSEEYCEIPSLLPISDGSNTMHICPTELRLYQNVTLTTRAFEPPSHSNQDHLVSPAISNPFNLLKCLTTLVITANTQISDRTISRLPDTLTELVLTTTLLSDSCAPSIHNLSQLTSLELRGTKLLTDSFIPYLPRRLKSLSLPSTSSFTDECVSYLPSTLERLNFASVLKFTRVAIAQLPRTLQLLYLTSWNPSSSELNDEDLSLLPPHLTELWMNSVSKLSGACLSFLPRDIIVLALPCISPVLPRHILDLPPYLHRLNLLGAQSLTAQDWCRLPSTIARLRSPKIPNEHKLVNSLPLLQYDTSARRELRY